MIKKQSLKIKTGRALPFGIKWNPRHVNNPFNSSCGRSGEFFWDENHEKASK